MRQGEERERNERGEGMDRRVFHSGAKPKPSAPSFVPNPTALRQIPTSLEKSG